MLTNLSLIAIAGPPAAGKTTLMRSLLPELGAPTGSVQWAQVAGTLYRETLALVLGVYDTDATAAGTDKLGMHVSPQAVRMLQALARDPQWAGWTVLMEGDRLVNDKVLGAALAAGIQLHLVMLDAPEDVLAARHAVRGDHQNATWAKGRVTKAERIAREYHALRLPHHTATDLSRAVNTILSLLLYPARVSPTATPLPSA